MWKKMSLIMMTCMIAFAFSAGGIVEAKPSYKSPKSSYSPGATTNPTNNSGINRNEPSTSKTPGATTGTTPTANRGFFSGGGLMKGMLIGGLAGMLFGGMFGNMGMLGNMLGLIVNVLAVVVVIAIVIKIIAYFRDKRKFDNQPKRY
jgi:predicted lipid-binding transport protein (Tim44 family)